MVTHQPSRFRTSIENSSTLQSCFGAALTTVILACVVALGAFVFGQGVVTTMLITIIAVIGLHIFSGNSGIMSFGHARFVALGPYVSGLLTMSAENKAAVLPDLPWWLSNIELSLVVALVVTIFVVVAVAIGGTVFVTLLNEMLHEAEAGFQIFGITVGPIFGATQFTLAGLMLVVMYFRRDGLFGLREPGEWLMVRLGR